VDRGADLPFWLNRISKLLRAVQTNKLGSSSSAHTEAAFFTNNFQHFAAQLVFAVGTRECIVHFQLSVIILRLLHARSSPGNKQTLTLCYLSVANGHSIITHLYTRSNVYCNAPLYQLSPVCALSVACNACERASE
jgi:hypothetical protein